MRELMEAGLGVEVAEAGWILAHEVLDSREVQAHQDPDGRRRSEAIARTRGLGYSLLFPLRWPKVKTQQDRQRRALRERLKRAQAEHPLSEAQREKLEAVVLQDPLVFDISSQGLMHLVSTLNRELTRRDLEQWGRALADWAGAQDPTSTTATLDRERPLGFQLVDRWGNPVKLEWRGISPTLVSFGSDQIPGGEGHEGDLEVAIPPPTHAAP